MTMNNDSNIVYIIPETPTNLYNDNTILTEIQEKKQNILLRLIFFMFLFMIFLFFYYLLSYKVTN